MYWPFDLYGNLSWIEKEGERIDQLVRFTCVMIDDQIGPVALSAAEFTSIPVIPGIN